jgi:predicted amidohydrolase YtcJ
MYKKTHSLSVLLCLTTLAGCSGGSVDSIDGGSAESPAAATAAPDQILSNGKILTVDAEFNVVEAIAIDGDRILATGSDEAILSLAGPETEVTDLEGRTVIPGLIDNHVHYIRTVQRWHQQARIDGIDSREEALAIVAEHATGLPAGEWFMVQG